MNIEELELEEIQLSLLLEAILKRYGYDCTGYTKSSLKRRVRDFILKESLEHYYDLIKRVIADEAYFYKFLSQLTVSVTEMFRDPLFYKKLREKVIPILKTYPTIRVWHAGCSTGEEAFSLAILFEEEGLLNCSKIYATDVNESSIQSANNGIYGLDKIKKYTENYIKFGGKGSFSDYYHVRYDQACIEPQLREHITFSTHNLVTDTNFAQFNLILCRNVLIYFNSGLQNNVLSLINNSLDHYGYFCLGMKETLSTTDMADKFEVVDKRTKIYQKKGW